jgi:hypothetical protein
LEKPFFCNSIEIAMLAVALSSVGPDRMDAIGNLFVESVGISFT